MPPAHGFWVIMAGDTPTAFRARTREVLLPTLYQLRQTQPTVSLQWFEHNRLWSGPLEAREALLAVKERQKSRRPDWRPGGAHKDPKSHFKLTRDQKRARYKRKVRAGDYPKRPKRS